MFEIKFKITNVTCEACVKLSVMALKKLSGVNNVEVDFTTGFSKVQSNEVISLEEIEKALETVDKKVTTLN